MEEDTAATAANTAAIDSHRYLPVTLLKAFSQIKHFFSQCCSSHTPFLSHCLNPDPATTFTGTIICPVDVGEKLRLCIQEDSASSPLVLLDLPLSTPYFSRLIRHGTAIGMALEGVRCECDPARPKEPLLSMPKWIMHCNGRKMGFAKRRREVAGKDAWLLEMLRGVSAGAGVMPEKNSGGYKYLRGQFEKVGGSGDDSEAYHLIDPSCCFRQELSVFFLRSSTT